MRIKFLILYLPLLSVFLFASCSGDHITDSVSGSRSTGTAEAGAVQEGGGKDSVLERGITSSGRAYVVVSRWVIDHYEAVPGMIVGTWARDKRYANGTLGSLHTKWGFNYLLMPDFYGTDNLEAAFTAGFPESRMLIAMSPDTHEKMINLFRERVYGYYIDEPADMNFYLDPVISYKKQHSPSNLFLISGYKRTALLDSFVQSTDGVAFSSYDHWYLLFGYWVSWPVNSDQRVDWTDMQKRYGSKFSWTWIGAHKDLLEYEQLLQHAKSLGLKSVWLYQYEDATDDISDANVSIFALYAWKYGFLNRFERREILRLENAVSDEMAAGNTQKESWKVTETRSTHQLRRVPSNQLAPDKQ